MVVRTLMMAMVDAFSDSNMIYTRGKYAKTKIQKENDKEEIS